MNAKKAFYSNYFRFSLHTNPFNATHALLGSICYMSPLIYLVFPTVCLGFVNGSCPVQTHSSALSAGAVGGFAQRHVKKRGRRYSREKTACLHPPPLLAYVELGFKPETFKSTTSLSLPLRPLPASPRGCVTRGLLKSAYGPGKKKKC